MLKEWAVLSILIVFSESKAPGKSKMTKFSSEQRSWIMVWQGARNSDENEGRIDQACLE